MSAWLIRPRDPLVLRDGRPFGPDPGARATSLSFPFPSTTAGAVRTRYGLANGGFGDGGVRLEEVKKWRVRGPLLVKLLGQDLESRLLLPRPQDALLLPIKEQAKGNQAARLWLRPLQWPDGALSNLSPSLDSASPLVPVGPKQPRMAKPIGDAPAYWTWQSYQQWLTHPGDDEVDLTTLGNAGPTRESRMHVRVSLETQTATEGMLFQTSGMEFTQRGPQATWWQVGQSEEMGLLVETDAPLRDGTGVLGGEGRMVYWQGLNDSLPSCPDEIVQSVLEHKACRLILATPAHFSTPVASPSVSEGVQESWGHLPSFGWLHKEIPGLVVKIKGAIVQGMEVVSGWSYEKPVGPKKTRRLVPAGSVFYLSLAGSGADEIHAFLRHTWLQSISDQTQDRLDGFGLALVGTWKGDFATLDIGGAQ